MSFDILQSDRSIFLQITIGNIAIPTHTYVVDVSIECGCNVMNQAIVHFFDPSWTEIEAILLRAKSPGLDDITIEYGWLGGPHAIYQGVVSEYHPTFAVNGEYIELICRKDIKEESQKLTASWPANTAFSTVVQDIADFCKWTTYGPLPQVAGQRGIDSGSYIEETIKSDKEWIMSNKLPFAWIVDTACSPGGRGCRSAKTNHGGYKAFFDRAGRFHFHTPEFLPGGVTRSYIFAKDIRGQVLSYSPKDQGQYTTAMGSGKLLSEAVDPAQKTVRKNKKSPNGEGGYPPEPIALLGSGGKIQENPSDTKRKNQGIKTFDQTLCQQLDRSALVYHHFARLTIEAELEIMGDPGIDLNALISVTLLKPDNTIHYLSGIFTVLCFKDIITPGSFTSSLTLLKAASLEGVNAVDGDNNSGKSNALMHIIPTVGPLTQAQQDTNDLLPLIPKVPKLESST